ncbi:hypothetical protein U0355_10550 [Salimicrobium sp. PL1-032A]|uniref:hypothetical protein n=1 Tax=Salimicrobium sp. PL1-032A TaxID=3095364 RepID=UPI0032604477
MSTNRKVIGIVAAPGYSDRIGTELEETIPELLEYYVDHKTKWTTESDISPLTGMTEKTEEVIAALLKEKEERRWDMAICLTDLPLLHEGKLVIAEANEKKGVGLVSLPGLGATPLIKRVREAFLHLISEMHDGSSDESRKEVGKRWNQMDAPPPALKKKDPMALIQKRGFDRLSPIYRSVTNNEDNNIDVRFQVESRPRGALRMVTGMVRANRPWRIFPSFFRMVAASFGIGSFCLVFPTLWMLSNHYTAPRIAGLAIMAMGLLTAWLIVAHKLWEQPKKAYSAYLSRLYNGTTLLTLMTGVLFYYLLLYVCFQGMVLLMVPLDTVDSEVVGELDPKAYIYMAWITTSVSTILGALGSTLEKEETVLDGTYGYRQKERYEWAKRQEDDEEGEKG